MIGLIDFGVCNIGSIRNMLRHCGVLAEIVNTPGDMEQYDKFILPGIGHFDVAMKRLNDLGFVEIIKENVSCAHKPILGICLGMQLLGISSEEGEQSGLGLIDGKSIAFDKSKWNEPLRIPHMGWNTVLPNKSHVLTESVDSNTRFYFAHTYHMKLKNQEDVLLWGDYGYRFAAALNVGNIYGVQFHPEKSHHFGKQLLENFARRV